ncbi:MAG TPA: hypothetical protein VLH86_04155 [Patescibacteria group bacterium]|nr:hypothetical protein [Patescibacteria group bacterium]
MGTAITSPLRFRSDSYDPWYRGSIDTQLPDHGRGQLNVLRRARKPIKGQSFPGANELTGDLSDGSHYAVKCTMQQVTLLA